MCYTCMWTVFFQSFVQLQLYVLNFFIVRFYYSSVEKTLLTGVIYFVLLIQFTKTDVYKRRIDCNFVVCESYIYIIWYKIKIYNTEICFIDASRGGFGQVVITSSLPLACLIIWSPWYIIFLHALFVLLSSFSPAFVLSLIQAFIHLKLGRPLRLFHGVSTCMQKQKM